MKKHQILSLFLVLILFSCHQKQLEISSNTYSEFQKKGQEISNLAQSILLANVGQAIQKGGTEYAVEFCNLNAFSIIDSLNHSNKCTISRVSNKNRNPKNALKNKQEEILWELFEGNVKADTILQTSKKLVYYKRIHIALPACLKCHGIRDADINLPTQKKLQKLYPNDLATGYDLNDFRGLWKIEFDAN
ncbi:MAG: DUF3365 domain-containing protein [Bacteroidetes bacterium]|nr:DUF3365 domain-containing protein [Bacteroidota bacterium]